MNATEYFPQDYGHPESNQEGPESSQGDPESNEGDPESKQGDAANNQFPTDQPTDPHLHSDANEQLSVDEGETSTHS